MPVIEPLSAIVTAIIIKPDALIQNSSPHTFKLLCTDNPTVTIQMRDVIHTKMAAATRAHNRTHATYCTSH